MDAEVGVDRACEQFGPAHIDADSAPRGHMSSLYESRMSDDPDNRAQSDDPPYRVYGGRESSRSATEQRPYNTYRSRPRGLLARLRGEEDVLLPGDDDRRNGERRRFRSRPGDHAPQDGWAIARRVLKYVAIAAVGWLLLSLVLFIVSAQIEQGKVDSATTSALTSGGNMLTSTDTVLIIGTDQRPKGTHEAGANTNDAGSRSDTIMLWRIGGGVSRRLSIPRDTVAAIPGHGTTKINAAYAYGGAPLLIRTINRLVDPVQVNHIVLVNFAGFKELIDSLGGVTLYNKRAIKSSQPFDGHNWFFKQGTIHLDGRHALAYSRIRHTTNPADTDISRTERQQLVMQALSRQLVSLSTFLHLPSVGSALGKPLTTDLSANELIGMGWDKFRASRTLECHMGGTPQVIGGQDVLLSVPENRSVIQEFLGNSAPLAPAKGQLYGPGCYVK